MLFVLLQKKFPQLHHTPVFNCLYTFFRIVHAGCNFRQRFPLIIKQAQYLFTLGAQLRKTFLQQTALPQLFFHRLLFIIACFLL
jgi:hypothetical protein